MNYPRIIIAGTHSGAGKTTIALGIMEALKRKGLNVQPFKTGPDYIDPTYHTQATGNICRNLDTWLLPPGTIRELFERQAEKADISIIEGVMGLYDGLKNSESGSTAHLAKILACPVILVLDARSLSRSAAAIALGYREFDKEVDIAGIILNNIGSSNHYRYIKDSIEKETKMPVFGFLPKDPSLKLPERHLGLVPAPENKLSCKFRKKISDAVESNIDLKKILRTIRRRDMPPGMKKNIFEKKPESPKTTIAFARDEAFNFYYQDNLDIIGQFGAKLTEFSPLRSKKLPSGTDGIYIGGGFPELFASRLSKNTKLKENIRQCAKEGMPIYAECGGLMYLTEELIDFKKNRFPMAGVFKCSVSMAGRRQALGYATAETIKDNILSKKGNKERVHIFHWSSLDSKSKNLTFAYKIKKSGSGIFYDGLVKKNVLAAYAHLHFASNVSLAKNFINNCRRQKKLWLKD